MVLHDHAHVVIAGCTAEAVGFQLGSIGKLLYRHGVFLLRHERTTKIVYRLWILLILGDSLAILGFCHCPFLGFEGTIALTDQIAISLGSDLCRTHQQHCHSYYYIMYILHFYIYILKLLPFQGALRIRLYFGSFKESLLKNLMFLSNGFFTSSMQTSMMSRRMMRMPTA